MKKILVLVILLWVVESHAQKHVFQKSNEDSTWLIVTPADSIVKWINADMPQCGMSSFVWQSVTEQPSEDGFGNIYLTLYGDSSGIPVATPLFLKQNGNFLDVCDTCQTEGQAPKAGFYCSPDNPLCCQRCSFLSGTLLTCSYCTPIMNNQYEYCLSLGSEAYLCNLKFFGNWGNIHIYFGASFSLARQWPANYKMNQAVSIKELNSIKIITYPNPTKNQIKISIKDNSKGKFSLMSISGVVIHEVDIKDEDVIDISALPSGNYIYQTQLNGYRKFGNLVIYK